MDVIKNGLKLGLIDNSKSNSKFAFQPSYEEKLIVNKGSSISQEKKHSCQGKCYWKQYIFYLDYLPGPNGLSQSVWFSTSKD